MKPDFEPDKDKDQKEQKEKQKSQNSFDPKKDANHDKIKFHNKYGKFYRDAKDNKVWYSKEVSGDRAHAGEHWKKFIQKGKELHHEANVDMAGNVMNSNKGQTGSIIRIKDLIGIK